MEKSYHRIQQQMHSISLFYCAWVTVKIQELACLFNTITVTEFDLSL